MSFSMFNADLLSKLVCTLEGKTNKQPTRVENESWKNSLTNKVSVLQNCRSKFYLQTWLNSQIRSLRTSLQVFTLSCTFVLDVTLVYHLNASTLEIGECKAISELLCLRVGLLPVYCTMHPAVCEYVCVCFYRPLVGVLSSSLICLSH